MFPDNLATQDLLDLTTTGFVICTLIGLVIISMYHHRQKSNDNYKNWYVIATSSTRLPTTTYCVSALQAFHYSGFESILDLGARSILFINNSDCSFSSLFQCYCAHS